MLYALDTVVSICARLHSTSEQIPLAHPFLVYSTPLYVRTVMDFVISPNLVEQLEQDSVIHLPKREEMNT